MVHALSNDYSGQALEDCPHGSGVCFLGASPDVLHKTLTARGMSCDTELLTKPCSLEPGLRHYIIETSVSSVSPRVQTTKASVSIDDGVFLDNKGLAMLTWVAELPLATFPSARRQVDTWIKQKAPEVSTSEAPSTAKIAGLKFTLAVESLGRSTLVLTVEADR